GRRGGGWGIFGGVYGWAFGGGGEIFGSNSCNFLESQSSALPTASPIFVSGNFISPILKSGSDFRASMVWPGRLRESAGRTLGVSSAWYPLTSHSSRPESVCTSSPCTGTFGP